MVATSVTAIDGSPEMLERCRARVSDPHVRYLQADLFAWEPEQLQRRLAELGWSAQVKATSEFFVYGHATPAS